MLFREGMREDEGLNEIDYVDARRRAALRIYSAEYFAVLREWRIRMGVAYGWCCRDAFLNI